MLCSRLGKLTHLLAVPALSIIGRPHYSTPLTTLILPLPSTPSHTPCSYPHHCVLCTFIRTIFTWFYTTNSFPSVISVDITSVQIAIHTSRSEVRPYSSVSIHSYFNAFTFFTCLLSAGTFISKSLGCPYIYILHLRTHYTVANSCFPHISYQFHTVHKIYLPHHTTSS